MGLFRGRTQRRRDRPLVGRGVGGICADTSVRTMVVGKPGSSDLDHGLRTRHIVMLLGGAPPPHFAHGLVPLHGDSAPIARDVAGCSRKELLSKPSSNGGANQHAPTSLGIPSSKVDSNA